MGRNAIETSLAAHHNKLVPDAMDEVPLQRLTADMIAGVSQTEAHRKSNYASGDSGTFV